MKEIMKKLSLISIISLFIILIVVSETDARLGKKCNEIVYEGSFNISTGFYNPKNIDMNEETTEDSCIGILIGDADSNVHMNVGDIVYLINYLFKGGPPIQEPCSLEKGNANYPCDYVISISDAIYLINYLFKSGCPPGICNCHSQ